MTATAPRQVRVTLAELVQRAIAQMSPARQQALADLGDDLEHRRPLVVTPTAAAALTALASTLRRATGTVPASVARLQAIARSGHFDPDPGALLLSIGRREAVLPTDRLAAQLRAWVALADDRGRQELHRGLQAEVESWAERASTPPARAWGRRLLAACDAAQFRPVSAWPRRLPE